MHIRTDDDVYRVDAVWLGPPRATFPWRARYSAYGVGLLIMIVIMFVQRRLGIDIGFFSVAWSLLITVVATRFVSRRINDERPLLEWLTLFSHELRGPRPRTRAVGGALATGHVAVRRDRPRAARAPAGTAALPRGAGREHPAPALAASRSDGFGPPSTAEVGTPDPAPGPRALPAAPVDEAVSGMSAMSAEAIVASWGGPERAEPVRVTARRVDRSARAGEAERAGRGPRAFGPGAGRRAEHGQEGDGATSFDRG